jgi:hypothetical protein
VFRPLPLDSARTAWWLSAWLRGDVAPDDLQTAVIGEDAAHHVAGLPGESEPVPLLLALGLIRALGTQSAGLAVPVEGDPYGLGGPPALNADALDAGEAVVLAGAGHALVPHRAGAGVVWQLHPAWPRQLVDLGEADRSLRAALTSAADALAELDVASWQPAVADELLNLRHVPTYAAPPGTPPRAIELAGRSVQASTIISLAMLDDGGAVSSYEVTARSGLLRGLESAARRALVAACSPEVWPPSGR